MSYLSKVCISAICFLILMDACSVTKNDVTDSKSNNKTYSRITPEPGTHITRMATLVLRYGNDFINHPDALFKKYGDHMEGSGPHIGLIKDTIILSGDYMVPVRIYYPLRKSKCAGM